MYLSSGRRGGLGQARCLVRVCHHSLLLIEDFCIFQKPILHAFSCATAGSRAVYVRPPSEHVAMCALPDSCGWSAIDDGGAVPHGCETVAFLCDSVINNPLSAHQHAHAHGRRCNIVAGGCSRGDAGTCNHSAPAVETSQGRPSARSDARNQPELQVWRSCARPGGVAGVPGHSVHIA